MGMGARCWVLEVDIKSYFDTVEHKHVREFVGKRVRDGVVKRMVGKWLKAGVMEGERLYYPERGTPQGGVISPLLANIYLHEVLDTWFEQEVRSRLFGKAELIRFADDFVIVFANQRDAQRVYEVLPKRLARFGLAIQEAKTRLLDFSRPRGEGCETETYYFLGFTHYWGKSLKGSWVVKRKTDGKKLRGAVRRFYQWCKENRHMPVEEQWEKINLKVQGHYGYYGITGNFRSLKGFYKQAKRSWRKWLDRRSRERDMDWEKFNKLLKRYPIPAPRIVHCYT
jgi:group II intron reverse transcriptase/maturase